MYVAPRDAVEAQIAAIFSAVTGAVPIGVNDNFFALGGDSLQGFQVVARIRSALQVSLSIVDLFGIPTVAQLAAAVRQRRRDADATALDRILREIESPAHDGPAHARPKHE
jgi:acyl carrier protein